MIDTPTPDAPQPYDDQMERPSQGRLRRLVLLPPTEVSQSPRDTLPLVAIDLGEIEQQQSESTPEENVDLGQRQAITTMAGGAAIVGIGEVLGTVLRYLGNIAMTHILTQSAYGIFLEALTAVTIVGYLANAGLNTAILRFLSIYHAKGEHDLAAGLIRFAVWVTLISGILCGVVFFLSTTALAYFAHRVSIYELRFQEMSLLIPLTALQLTLTSGLQALKAFKWRVYVDRLIQPGLTLVLMGVFYLLGLRLGGVILATLCGFLAATIAGQFLLGKAAKPLVRDVIPKFERKAWLLFATPMLLYTMIQAVSGNIDILFLGALSTPAQVGLYGVADRTSGFILLPFTALTIVFYPLITEYYARDEHVQLAKTLKLVTKWALSLSLPVFLCYCVFHTPILSIFSREYTAGGVVLIVDSLGNLAFVVTAPVSLLLLTLGRTRLLLANSVLSIAINAGLAFLLIPHFNAVGAAIAVAASLIISGVINVVEVYWIMKIHPFRWDMLKPMVAGGVAAVVGFLLLHVLPFPNERLGTVEELALIIPFVLIYVLVFALLRLSEEDTIVFDAIRTKLSVFARPKG